MVCPRTAQQEHLCMARVSNSVAVRSIAGGMTLLGVFVKAMGYCMDDSCFD